MRDQDSRIATLSRWIAETSLPGCPQAVLLEKYCLKLRDLGVPLLRFHVTQNAHHPVYGGIGFQWLHQTGPERVEYAHVDGDQPETWLQSPFAYMLNNQLVAYRERLTADTAPSRFPLLNEMRETGATDYVAAALLFQAIDLGDIRDDTKPPEGALLSWMTDAQGGFSDDDLDLIETTLPILGMALKAEANRKTAVDLLGVYLGRDAGRRVLSGDIRRGSSQWINAVICYFDLQGFTALSQRIPGEAIIRLLNDYFGLVVTEIEQRGGNVLKYMGDGLLAIFDRETFDDATRRAIETARSLEAKIDAMNTDREARSLPTAGFTLAIHAGPVLYGNIGGEERLDFTVIGPEVNLTARLSGMHRPLGQTIVLSDAAVRDIDKDDMGVVSLGRYMLRGVDQPIELFTLFTPSAEREGEEP